MNVIGVNANILVTVNAVLPITDPDIVNDPVIPLSPISGTYLGATDAVEANELLIVKEAVAALEALSAYDELNAYELDKAYDALIA